MLRWNEHLTNTSYNNIYRAIQITHICVKCTVTMYVFVQDMLCFSGNGMLSIKASNFPAHQRKQQVHCTESSLAIPQVLTLPYKLSLHFPIGIFHAIFNSCRALLLASVAPRFSVCTSSQCQPLTYHRWVSLHVIFVSWSMYTHVHVHVRAFKNYM